MNSGQNDKVVVGDVSPHPIKELVKKFHAALGTNRGRLTAFIVVIVVVGGTVGGYYAFTHWFAHKKPSTEQSLAALVTSQVLEGRLDVNNPASKETLEKGLQSASEKKEKITLLNALATNAEARQDYRNMTDYLIRAYQAGATDSTTVLSIADTYDNQLHEKDNALKYYKIALTSAQKEKEQGDRLADAQIKYIEDTIKTVEANGAH
ncbi:MAG: hypothetical protein JWL85_428 [Candidatus Saccharibacteria bacterium]|nr:hypothetical protein [Candidatus Saccharibacteria bacterium]